MTDKSNYFREELLDLVFLNLALLAIGDAGGLLPSAAPGSLYLTLHTADPGGGGSQNTSEATYTGYGRVAVGRTASDWTRTANAMSNDNEILFGENTGSAQTITHVAVGTDAAGAGNLLYWDAPSGGSITVDPNETPRFAASSITFTET